MKWEKPRGVCECTDSIHAALGRCPEKGHREFHFCPKRKPLTTKEEVAK